jgi:hypothetical protein
MGIRGSSRNPPVGRETAVALLDQILAGRIWDHASLSAVGALAVAEAAVADVENPPQ